METEIEYPHYVITVELKDGRSYSSRSSRDKSILEIQADLEKICHREWPCVLETTNGEIFLPYELIKDAVFHIEALIGGYDPLRDDQTSSAP